MRYIFAIFGTGPYENFIFVTCFQAKAIHHMQEICELEKDHQCSKCSQNFFYDFDLDVHKFIGCEKLKGKRLKCKSCKMVFKRKIQNKKQFLEHVKGHLLKDNYSEFQVMRSFFKHLKS